MTTRVRRYLRHYRSSGHVWQGRFKAFPTQEDEHLLTVLRYIERNPLRAGLVDRAEAWRWSSLHWHGEPGRSGSFPPCVPFSDFVFSVRRAEEPNEQGERKSAKNI